MYTFLGHSRACAGSTRTDNQDYLVSARTLQRPTLRSVLGVVKERFLRRRALNVLLRHIRHPHLRSRKEPARTHLSPFKILRLLGSTPSETSLWKKSIKTVIRNISQGNTPLWTFLAIICAFDFLPKSCLLSRKVSNRIQHKVIFAFFATIYLSSRPSLLQRIRGTLQGKTIFK